MLRVKRKRGCWRQKYQIGHQHSRIVTNRIILSPTSVTNIVFIHILNSLKKNILRNEAFGDSKSSRKKIAIIYSTEEVTAKRQAFVQSYWSGMPIEDIPFVIIVGIGKLKGVKSLIIHYSMLYN